LQAHGIETRYVHKINEGRPHVVDRIKNKEVHLVINTPTGKKAKLDERYIGEAALLFKIPIITTITGATGLVKGIRAIMEEKLDVKTIQEHHASL
jgi:carbamoyl-phosphate synthase large subunit